MFTFYVNINGERRVTVEKLVSADLLKIACSIGTVVNELQIFGRCCCAHQSFELSYSAVINNAHLNRSECLLRGGAPLN